jgi:2-haloacid dehalogenase
MPKDLFVFDAYGTLFDVTGAVRQTMATDPRHAAIWPALAEDWRRKQLEYTWLRAIMGAHADFAEVVTNALDWALDARGLADAALRDRLLAAFRRLPCFPEAPAALATLKGRGKRLAILSNGTPTMLAETVAAAGLQQFFDEVISVERAGVYKPDARVYALVEVVTGVPPHRVAFVSANGWDVAGAARFGFSTAWINRTGAPIDRLPHGPAHIITDLTQLESLA